MSNDRRICGETDCGCKMCGETPSFNGQCSKTRSTGSTDFERKQIEVSSPQLQPVSSFAHGHKQRFLYRIVSGDVNGALTSICSGKDNGSAPKTQSDSASKTRPSSWKYTCCVHDGAGKA